MSLLNDLRQWRHEQARREGVEPYRVLSNAVLDALIAARPTTTEELLLIKGIKETKSAKYGTMLLRILHPEGQEREEFATEQSSLEERETETALSVSQFLDGVNMELSGLAARVQGEVSSIDIRERVVYFTLKDREDESVLSCLIFRHQYILSGVNIQVGDDILIEGAPDIYKPTGRLSFKAGYIELCGEGALKRAYDRLKGALEQEGFFAPEKKQPLPSFPNRIALITSEQGAAIGDFSTNLGMLGIQVHLYPVSVEGKKAVPEILEALRFFEARAQAYDLLVMIRGGGSLESLQAFNNENLVRAVAACPLPTLLGIGHEKDITLAALAADAMVSTPTAAARTIREPWEEARGLVEHFTKQLPVLLERELLATQHTLSFSHQVLVQRLTFFTQYIAKLRQKFLSQTLSFQELVHRQLAELTVWKEYLLRGGVWQQEMVQSVIARSEDALRHYDPLRALRLGYSLVRHNAQIIKDVSEVVVGDILTLQLSKGKLSARVEKLFKESSL